MTTPVPPPWALNPGAPQPPAYSGQALTPPSEPYTAAYGSASNGVTLSAAVIQNVAQGDALVVAASSNSAVTAAISCADTQNNSYQLVAVDTNRSPNAAIFVALGCAPLVQSVDSVTVTYSGSASVKQLIARGYNQVAAFDAVDQAAGPADGNSAAPAASTAALGYGTQWAVAVLASATGGGPPAQGAWTGGFQPVTTIGPGPFLTLADQLVTSPAALTAATALGAVATWSMVLITLAPVPMINPLPAPAPPGLIPALAWQQLSLPGTMQGPPPAAAAASPVYPPGRPVQARSLPQRGGMVIWRAGVPGQAGPPVYPPHGPARAQPAFPFLTGRAAGRAGPLGVTGPPVRHPSGPAASVSRGLPPRGRIVRAAGPYAGTGAPPVPLRQPVSAARRPLPSRGRTQSLRGPYAGTGPPVTPPRRPVGGQPQRPFLTGRAAGRAGVRAGPPAFTVGTLTASGAPTGVLTGATASGGSGGVLTTADTRTGGPGG